jgi:homoserine O-acetyltransferase
MIDALKRVKNAKLYLILANDETSGHLTTANAKFYQQELQKLLEAAPERGM